MSIQCQRQLNSLITKSVGNQPRDHDGSGRIAVIKTVIMVMTMTYTARDC